MEDIEEFKKRHKTFPYCTDYAKSSRSKCRGCHEKIRMDALRLAIRGDAHPWRSEILSTEWYHFTCFFNHLKPGTHQITGDSIGDLFELKFVDKELIDKKIREFNLKADSLKKTSHEVSSNESEKTTSAVKGKVNLDSRAPPAKRSRKEHMKEQNDLKSQDLLISKYRKFFGELSTRNLIEHMHDYGVKFNFGNSDDNGCDKYDFLDVFVDYCLFGKPARCPECSKGHIIYSVRDQTYVCLGVIGTKCSYTNRNPPRWPFQIPEPPFCDVFEEWRKNKEMKVNALFGKERLYADTGASGDVSCWKAVETTSSTSNKDANGKKNKLMVKYGNIVEEEFAWEKDYHVHKDEEGRFYKTALVWTDSMNEDNIFHKIVLLKHNSKEEYLVSYSWEQGSVKECLAELIDQPEPFTRPLDIAVSRFADLFRKNTGNSWGSRQNKGFVKQEGKYDVVEKD